MAKSEPPAHPLLITLNEISEWASRDGDPVRALTNIACLIGNRFGSDVCSIYLFGPEEKELVLSATVGLHQDSVGHVRMTPEEGLTGLVAQQRRPVLVENASEHPRFKYFPEAGEDPYHLFLGVPIMDGEAVHGVLVVQTIEPRVIETDDLRLLMIAGRQLGAVAPRFRARLAEDGAPALPN